MPTYEYRCDHCGHEMEEFQSITAKSLTKCPHCNKNKLKRLIGIGAAVIFKGSGFYETDYRSSSYQKDAKADKQTPEKSDSKSDKSDTSSSSSSDSKTSQSSTPKSDSSKKTDTKPKAKKNDA